MSNCTTVAADPVEINENFPFTCTIVAKVSEPFSFLSDMTNMKSNQFLARRRSEQA